MASNLCIGLFGTCGNSTWRDDFIKEYEKRGIQYFNPNKAEWTKEDAKIEAEHLADDKIILFPITNETYATGSLSEVGFSILQAIRLDDRRDFAVMIDDDLLPELIEENPSTAKESIRARAIVRQHLKKLRMSNVYLVNTLQELLEVSLVLYNAATVKETLNKYNIF